MDEKRVDSYLFNEMPETERAEFEDRFVGDDVLFAEIAERENELVDRFVRNELSESDRVRFEGSRDGLPGRRQKVANAALLREFIAGERENKTITIAERTGFFSRVAELLSFKSPALQFASIGTILLLALVSVFLLIENRRIGSLESELAQARQRESELTAQIETAHEATGELTTDLNAERERIQKLETEIALLQHRHADTAVASNRIKPTIATLLLSAGGIRGPGPRPVQRLDLPAGVGRVAIVLDLPNETPAGARVSAKLNGVSVASDLPVRTQPNGAKLVSFSIPATRLNETRNAMLVVDGSGNTIETYAFSVSREK